MASKEGAPAKKTKEKTGDEIASDLAQVLAEQVKQEAEIRAKTEKFYTTRRKETNFTRKKQNERRRLKRAEQQKHKTEQKNAREAYRASDEGTAARAQERKDRIAESVGKLKAGSAKAGLASLEAQIGEKKARLSELKAEAGRTMSRKRKPKEIFAEILALEAEVTNDESEATRLQERIAHSNSLKGVRFDRKYQKQDDNAEQASVGSNEPKAAGFDSAGSADEVIDAEFEDVVHSEPPSVITLPDLSGEQIRSGAFADTTADSIKEVRANLARAAAKAAPSSAPPSSFEYDEAGAFLGVQDLDAPRTPDAPTMTAEEQVAMAGRFSPEEAARIFQSGGDMPVEDVPEIPAPPEKAPRDPYTAEDMQVMVNPVLTKQAFGGNTTKFKQFKKEYGFPAAGAVPGDAPPAVKPPKAEERRERGDNKRWKKWPWLVAAAGFGALIFGIKQYEKSQDTRPVSGPPTAARSAAEAGITPAPYDQSSVLIPKSTLGEGAPVPLSQWGAEVTSEAPTTAPLEAPSAAPVAKAEKRASRAEQLAALPPAVTRAVERAVEAGSLHEEDAKMIQVWQHMAMQKAREGLPPKSDERILEVAEIIRANKDNPYAFRPGGVAPKAVAKTETVPPAASPIHAEPFPGTKAPEAVPMGPRALRTIESPGLYRYKGAVTAFGGKPEERFALAQLYVKQHPNETVQFFSLRRDNQLLLNTVRMVGGAMTTQAVEARKAPQAEEEATPIALPGGPVAAR